MLAGPACRPLVQLLLSKQVDPTSAVDCFFDELAGLTPLHLLACWSFHPKFAHTHGDAAWLRAAAAQQIAAVRDILQACSSDGSSVDVEARTACGKETPLTFAAWSGSWAVVELLLQAGADPNLPRLKDAVRPLNLAVAVGHARLGCLLLERGAEVCGSAREQNKKVWFEVWSMCSCCRQRAAVQCAVLGRAAWPHTCWLQQLSCKHSVCEQQALARGLNLAAVSDVLVRQPWCAAPLHLFKATIRNLLPSLAALALPVGHP